MFNWRFPFIVWSKLVVNYKTSSLLYYLPSITIFEGWYARQAILNDDNTDAGYPQHEKHLLSIYTTLFFWGAFGLPFYKEALFYCTPISEIFCLSIYYWICRWFINEQKL